MSDETAIEKVVEKPLDEQLMQENDRNKLDKIVDIFNLNIKKKDIIRTEKLSGLQDAIVNQMSERILTNANEFSNKELLEYFKAIQDTQNKADTSLDDINFPTISITNNELNINNEPKLTHESRAKVADAIKDILKNIQSQQENNMDEDDMKNNNEIDAKIIDIQELNDV